MKLTLHAFLSGLLGLVFGAYCQSMSPPSAVTKDQVLRMASNLTNGMPEQIANYILTNRGLRCSYTISATNARTYHYNFTNGWFELEMRPKQPASREQWRLHRDGFLTTASIHWYTNPVGSLKDIPALTLSLTNAP